MDRQELEIKLAALEKYIEQYSEKITPSNAQQAVEDFDAQWIEISGYVDDYTLDHKSKYDMAVVTYSAAIGISPMVTETMIDCLAVVITEYENIEYKYAVKQTLYFNLGLCWHQLGHLYDGKAIEAFKKYIYYLICHAKHNTMYSPFVAYAFRSCQKFLYQSLINDELNLSSPTEFNDPFDCPIRELLSEDDDVASLLRQAYNDCLKIACFVRNEALASDLNHFSYKKHPNDADEFLNELMWAHYADYHKGICVKYYFHNSFIQITNIEKWKLSFFRDVKYSDIDMSNYSDKDTIALEDAFFLKGKQWEYENELRFLYYDINQTKKYVQIKVTNSIEAIYFGLRCSNEDKKTIYNIMKDKKIIIEDLNGNVVKEQAVQFYEMKIDEKHFGQLTAVVYNP